MARSLACLQLSPREHRGFPLGTSGPGRRARVSPTRASGGLERDGGLARWTSCLMEIKRGWRDTCHPGCAFLPYCVFYNSLSSAPPHAVMTDVLRRARVIDCALAKKDNLPSVVLLRTYMFVRLRRASKCKPRRGKGAVVVKQANFSREPRVESIVSGSRRGQPLSQQVKSWGRL